MLKKLLLAAAILIKAALATFLNFRRMPRPNDLFYLVLFSNMLAFYFLMTNVAIYAWGQQADTDTGLPREG